MSHLHEFTQYIAPDGEIYRFDTGLDKFLISEEGLGMPPVEYLTSQSPTQQGVTVLDYRLRPRIIQLVHRSQSCSRAEYWQKRFELLSMIRPNRNGLTTYNLGKLRKIFSDGSMRDIYVTIDQGPAFTARDPNRWDEWAFTEALRFIAHDPLFFDPVMKSTTLTLATQGFTFPFSLPLLIDDDTIDSTISCVTAGTEDTYPDIILTGPLSGVVIRNETMNLEIKMVYNISIGEIVTIYLQPGNKRVMSNLVGDITATAYFNTDLATFRMTPHPKAVNGENTIRLHGAGVVQVGPSAMTVQWYDKFIGI